MCDGEALQDTSSPHMKYHKFLRVMKVIKALAWQNIETMGLERETF